MKDPAPSTIKICNFCQKQTVQWMVTVFLSAFFKKHLLIQLLINITFAEVLLKNVMTIIRVLSALNCQSMYGN